MRLIKSLLILLFCLGLPLSAQEAVSEYPVAAYGLDGNLYVFNLEAEPVLVHESSFQYLPSIYSVAPVWSSDGNYLAYQDYEYEASRDLWISPIHDLSTKIAVDSLDIASALAFTSDSQNLLYTRLGEWQWAANPAGFDRGTWQEAPLLLERFNFQNFASQSLSGNALPIIHGIDVERRVDIELSCAPGRLNVIESRWTHLSPLILADTPYGIVTYFNQALEYGRNSNLQIGNGLIEMPILENTSLSPNLEMLAFTIEAQNQIGTIGLENQEIQVYPTQHKPEAIVGDGEPFLYYAVQIEGTEPLFSREAWEQVQDYYCDEYINQVAIYRFDTQTETETLLFTSDAYAIPWMSLSPDGQLIYFTMIPNGEAWREATLQRNCTVGDCLEYIFPSLYQFDIANEETRLVLENVLKPVINFGYQGD